MNDIDRVDVLAEAGGWLCTESIQPDHGSERKTFTRGDETVKVSFWLGELDKVGHLGTATVEFMTYQSHYDLDRGALGWLTHWLLS